MPGVRAISDHAAQGLRRARRRREVGIASDRNWIGDGEIAGIQELKRRSRRHRQRAGAERTVVADNQRTAIELSAARIGVGAGQRQRASAALDQGTTGDARILTIGAAAAIADDPAHRRARVIAADGELVAAQIEITAARNRTGTELAVVIGSGAGGEIDHGAAAGVGEGGIAGGAGVEKANVAVVGDGGAAARASVVKNDGAGVGDGGAAARAGVVESDEAARVGNAGAARRAAVAEIDVAVVGDGGVAGRAGILESDDAERIVGNAGAAGRAVIEEVEGAAVIGDGSAAGRAGVVETDDAESCW